MAEPLEQNPRLPAAPPTAGLFSGEAAPAEQTYRPLPITVLIGFGIAALYALGITLAGLTALFNRKPLLLSGWAAAAPLSALLLCLLARGRIRAAEGTLAGEALARWGLLLSLFFGLGYWAYYGAVYLAVRQQSREFAGAWLEQLREGDMARGVLNILPPLKRLGLNENDPGFAAEIEQRLAAGTPRGTPVSLFNAFGQSALVRFLKQGGNDARITLRGLRSWEFSEGGYRAILDYDIEVPEGTFVAVVTVHGLEAPSHEYERRQWYVELSKTTLLQEEANIKLTPFGLNIGRVYQSATEFVNGWKEKMANPAREGAFVLMLPSSEREKVLADLEKAARLGAIAGPLGASLALPEGAALQQLMQFVAGSMIRAESKRFLVPDNERDEVLAKVYDMAAHGVHEAKIDLARAAPVRTLEGGRIRLSYDLHIGKPGDFMAECVLDIEGDANALESSKTDPAWRAVALRVVAGKRAPAPQMPEPPPA